MSHPGFDPQFPRTPEEPSATPAQPPAPGPPPYPPASGNPPYTPPTSVQPRFTGAGPVYPGQSPVPAAPPVPPSPGYAPPSSHQAPPSQPTQPGYPTQPGFTGGAHQAAPTPPTYDATSMPQQYSAPPTSGPYGYGGPMMSAIPGPPPRPGKGAIITLSILTTLFLVTTGIFGTLFLVKSKDSNRLSAQVAQLNTEVAAAKSKSETMQKDLDNAKRDLTDSKGQADELAAQKKAIGDCITAIEDLGQLITRTGSPTSPEVKAKETDVNTKCREADKYL